MSKYVNFITGQNEGSNELEGRTRTLELIAIRNKFKENENIKLKVKNDNKKQPIRIIEGTIIQKNKFLVFIRTKTGVESFKYSEFLEKRAKVI